MPPGAPERNEIHLATLLEAVGPQGLTALVILAFVLLLRSRAVRKALYKQVRSALRSLARWVGLVLWARKLGIGVRLAGRLLPERWDGMVAARKLPGLKRGKVVRTPSGIRVGLTLNGALTLDAVAARADQLEAGLGLRHGSARVKPGKRADRAELHIAVRDPLAHPIVWEAPARTVRLADPVRLAVTAHGDTISMDVRQRIGIFGTSGSGKSCVQRVLGAHVVQAVDANLCVIDLKQGLESQHFAGKAHRLTDTPAAAAYVDWLLDVEFPRRAARMIDLGTSTWRESEADPALVVMVDEGNVITRDFTTAQLKRFFTAVEQGRALGVYFVWVTQFPKSTNLPTELRSQLNVRVCLRLNTSEEAAIVFKDETSDGWGPHKLQDHWLLIKSSKHTAPEEAKAVWLDEKTFRDIAPGRAVPEPPQPPQGREAPPLPQEKRPAQQGTSKPPAARAEATVADLAWSALALADKPLGVRELARTIDRDPGATSRAVRKLAAAGQAAQTVDGKYEARLTADHG